MNSEHYDFNDLVKKLALKLQSGVDIDIYTTEGEVDRKYICECGYHADRDFNASLNLRDSKTYKIA